jgi:hypothetical protein
MTIATTPATRRKTGKYILLGLLLLLLLLLGWLGWKAWRVARTTQALLDRRPALEALAEGGLTGLDPDAAEQLVMDVRSDVLTLKSDAAPFLFLTPYLGWVPTYGSTLVIAPDLLDLAEAGLDTAAYAIRGLKPALIIMQQEQPSPDGTSKLSQLVQTLDAAQPDLRAAQTAFDEVIAARAAIGDTSALPGRVQSLFNQADGYLPLAEAGLNFALIAPAMMGSDGPRTYVVIAQNEDELRPTGGFISGAGRLTVENGQIQDFTFGDAYQIDNFAAKPYDIPPEPLEKFMGLDLFLFRDANFWADFPTSAEKMLDLYSYGQDTPPPDGLIAIDQQFMRLLVEATGPITIAGTDVVLNQNNILDAFREAWAGQEGEEWADWINTRKDFLGTFATAVRGKLENDLGSMDMVTLAQNMDAALQAKNLQIYSRHPAEDEVLTANGWNGRFPIPNQNDLLAIIDANVGYTKSNLYVEKSALYEITLNPDGTATGHLTLTYQHTRPTNGDPCIHYNLAAYAQVPDYLTLADACYWNYLRLYTPPATQLISATVHTIPGEAHRFGQTWQGAAQPIAESPYWTTFANYFLLPMGETLTSAFHYQLPVVVQTAASDPATYELTIVKQAGSHSYPLRAVVHLPAGAELLTAEPTPVTVSGQTITFDLTIDRNQMIKVQFQ